ncbi:MAG: hypothetical protein KatS3mg068_1879 [Candidatus Sericytochromatia bacterium]|nr:MAG: hypothetical protein KatS3mg068_1879 [Candidatus Sericytochromatia bacterium]
MHNKKILGYSIYFKKEKDAQDFFSKVPEIFSPRFNKEDKEVILLGINRVHKEDFSYVFKKEGYKLEIDPIKIEFIQILYER